MNRLQISLGSTLTIVVATLVGCGKTEAPPPPAYVMPEINDATCAKSAIEAMPISDELRREFGSKCTRRGSYTPSNPKSW